MAGMFSLGVLDGGLKAKLAKLDAAAENKTEIFDRVGAAVLTKVQLGFRTASDPYGMPWKPLKLRDGRPLSDTGRLRRSILAQSDNSGVTIGTNLKYARAHQFGATIVPKTAKRLVFAGQGGRKIFAKKVVIPARPYLPLNTAGQTVLPPTWRAAVVARLKAHFKAATKEVA